MRQSQQAVVLLLGLRQADSGLKRKVCLETAEELGILESSIGLSVINGINAIKELEVLHQYEILLEGKINKGVFEEKSQTQELASLRKIVDRWCRFAYPEQFPIPKINSKKKRVKATPTESLRDCLIPTLNRIKHSLKDLKKEGIRASIHSEDVRWGQERVLWIVFDVDIAIDSLVAFDVMWAALVDSLQPDIEKKVRQAAIDYYWQRIILVPLVDGKSIEQLAFTNMQIASAHLSTEDVNKQIWRFMPECVPDEIWGDLSLPLWDKSDEWFVFQRLADAYVGLYNHIEHLADITRIESLATNPVGETIVINYFDSVRKETEPYLQGALNAVQMISEHMSDELKELESEDELLELRPNFHQFHEMLSEVFDIVQPPTEKDGDAYLLASTELNLWRDQLKEGLEVLGIARTLWITDLLHIKTNELGF